MHRFHLPPDQCREPVLLLTGRDAHHGLHVLRLRRSETVTVLDGAGGEFRCEVQDCGKDGIVLAVRSRKQTPPPAIAITLLQAIPKGKIVEAIIQKATELAVTRIVPLLAARVNTRLDDEGASQKADKWQTVAIEAIKQCGAAWLPAIEAPLTPAEFLARKEVFELSLIASLQPGARHAREYFQQFESRHQRKPASVCIWIGPEGDFTQEEVSSVIAHGAFPINLGPHVLRVETAAIYCLSIVNYESQSPLLPATRPEGSG